AEVAEVFARADAVVLPYRRASSSGPLNIAMALGLPVVIYAVPALVEAVEGYEGAVVVPAGDVDALRDAIRTLPLNGRTRHQSPRSWDDVVQPYHDFLSLVAT
ncbi:MAG: glycosyltransferase family 4 protein, partial [Acidimicrobiales bacterium]|nr:glycosyltransferase family 4 protein [Acidimicrobiales bacterium]